MPHTMHIAWRLSFLPGSAMAHLAAPFSQEAGPVVHQQLIRASVSASPTLKMYLRGKLQILRGRGVGLSSVWLFRYVS